MISHDDIFRTGIALLAFIVAFYALIARERKTPYILNSIYAIAFIVLISMLLSLISKMIEPPSTAAMSPGLGATNAPPVIAGTTNVAPVAAGTTNTPASLPLSYSPTRLRWSLWLNRSAGALLGFGIVFILYRLWHIYNRQLNFRNDQLRFSVPGVLRLRGWLAESQTLTLFQ